MVYQRRPPIARYTLSGSAKQFFTAHLGIPRAPGGRYTIKSGGAGRYTFRSAGRPEVYRKDPIDKIDPMNNLRLKK